MRDFHCQYVSKRSVRLQVFSQTNSQFKEVCLGLEGDSGNQLAGGLVLVHATDLRDSNTSAIPSNYGDRYARATQSSCFGTDVFLRG